MKRIIGLCLVAFPFVVVLGGLAVANFGAFMQAMLVLIILAVIIGSGIYLIVNSD